MRPPVALPLLALPLLALGACARSADVAATADTARELELAGPAAPAASLGGDTALSLPAAAPAPAPAAAARVGEASAEAAPAAVPAPVLAAPNVAPAARRAPTPAPAAAPSPAAELPAPAPRPPAVPTIPAGTTLSLVSNAAVCTNAAHAGDVVTVALDGPVDGADGATLSGGTAVRLRVARVADGQLALEPAAVVVDGVPRPVSGSVTIEKLEAVRVHQKRRAGFGAIGGALLGAAAATAAGKDAKGAMVGAAAGAAAGAAGGAVTAGRAACLPQGGRVTLDLDAPLRLATP